MFQSLLCAASLVASTQAWPRMPTGSDIDNTQNSPTDGSGTVTLPVVRSPITDLEGRDLEVRLDNRSDVAYYAQLYIGTPPQKVYAQLDTGSFELWVNPDCSSLHSSSDIRFCQAVGEYDPDSSSTSHSTGDSNTLNYGLGKAHVKYYTDDLSLKENNKGAKLNKVRFGVANGKTDGQFAGVLGVGMGKGVNTKYPNVLDEMTNQDVISTKTFSLALGSKDEDGGVIIFGGVDRAKFKGSLAALDIIPGDDSPDGMSRYWVHMKSISHSEPGSGKSEKIDGTNMPVFLDSGATLSMMDSDVVESIADALSSEGKNDAGLYSLPCSMVEESGTVDFNFDGVTIEVPYKEIIRKLTIDGESMCYLGIAESDEFTLLGDTFLRSAYVVFDLDSETVFMAPYQNCGSDVSNINKSQNLKGMKSSCEGQMSDKEESVKKVSSKESKTSSDKTKDTGASKTGEGTQATSTSDPTGTQSDSPKSQSSETDSKTSESNKVEEDNGAGQLKGYLSVSLACITLMAML